MGECGVPSSPGYSQQPPQARTSTGNRVAFLVVAAKRDVEISDDAPQIVAETTVAGERGAAMRRGVSRLAGFVPTALARHCSGLFTSWSRSAAATTDDPGAPVLAAKAVKSVTRGRA
ncbi:hypothetical protein [Methylocystis echinoides]|uniref:hypothetical protein n=1 Tax=Methylocystis echinoides TaxID=29468 RepID=UPI003434DCC6